MLETIPIYELPFREPENSEFRIYKVRGKNITGNEFPHKTILPHKHNFYEICIFTGGTGEHDIDFKTWHITPPSIHLVYPGQVHLIHRGNNYQGYLIIFSREFLNLHFKNPDIIPGYSSTPQTGRYPVLNFNNTGFEDFYLLISCIEKEINNKSHQTLEIIVSFLRIFFLKLSSKFADKYKNNQHPPEPGENLSQSFHSLLETNFNNYHLVQDYAKLLGVSVYSLNNALKKHNRKTASELITDRLILEAKRLLAHSGMNTKEIAYLLNYDDPSYFSRIFRNKTGTSPSQFRNEIKNRYKL